MMLENEVSEIRRARAELKETFLRSVKELQGQPCTIVTYEKSTLHGTLIVWKPDGLEIIVKDLKTPANLSMESAILRTPDILAITFDDQ